MENVPRAGTPAVLISNPSAGRGRQRRTTRRILDVLRAGGYAVEALTTERPGHATELARSAAIRGVGAVFAHGGDGTLREAAAGVLSTQVPIGFIPGGTTNVMCLSLSLPRHPVRAAAALCRAGIREMDVGLCGNETFLMLASAGFDARVVTTMPPALKRLSGKLAVAWSALGHAFTYRFPEIAVEADGRRFTGTLVAVCNIPYYGGPWSLLPEARSDDRLLDLLVFRGRGVLATMALARDLLLGRRHLKRADVETVRAAEVTLWAGGAPLEIDGDLYRSPAPGESVTLRLSDVRLKVLAP